MMIQDITPQSNYTLRVVAHDGRVGVFDVQPYLQYEVFADLKNHDAFLQVSNGKYFVEWACGADLSADTIEAQWDEIHTGSVPLQQRASRHAERKAV